MHLHFLRLTLFLLLSLLPFLCLTLFPLALLQPPGLTTSLYSLSFSSTVSPNLTHTLSITSTFPIPLLSFLHPLSIYFISFYYYAFHYFFSYSVYFLLFFIRSFFPSLPPLPIYDYFSFSDFLFSTASLFLTQPFSLSFPIVFHLIDSLFNSISDPPFSI